MKKTSHIRKPEKPSGSIMPIWMEKTNPYFLQGVTTKAGDADFVFGYVDITDSTREIPTTQTAN
jgi:hypothetical protein